MLKAFLRYIVGDIAIKLVGLVSLPIYTAMMLPELYGEYSLTLSSISFAIVLFGLNFQSSVGRFFYERNLDRSIYFSTLTWSFLVVFFLAFLCFVIFGSQFFSDFMSLEKKVLYVAFGVVFFEIIISAYNQILIVNKGAVEYSLLGFFKSISTFALAILLLSYFEKSAISILISMLMVNFCIAVYSVLKIYPLVQFSFSLHALRYIANYSVFLIPYTLGGVALTHADKIMLSHFGSIDLVGIYSVAYTLSMIPYLLFLAISKAWTPYYFKYMNNEMFEMLERDVRFILLAMTILNLCFVMVVNLVFDYFISNSYADALALMPMLSSSVFYMVLWQMWGRAIGFSKKTIYSSLIGLFCAALNVLLNFILIPKLGMQGAAISTVISYLIMAFIGYWVSRRILQLFTVPISSLLLVIFLNFLIFIGAFFPFSLSYYFSLMIFLVLFAAYFNRGLISKIWLHF